MIVSHTVALNSKSMSTAHLPEVSHCQGGFSLSENETMANDGGVITLLLTPNSTDSTGFQLNVNIYLLASLSSEANFCASTRGVFGNRGPPVHSAYRHSHFPLYSATAGCLNADLCYLPWPMISIQELLQRKWPGRVFLYTSTMLPSNNINHSGFPASPIPGQSTAANGYCLSLWLNLVHPQPYLFPEKASTGPYRLAFREE